MADITWNPSDIHARLVLSEGNYKHTHTGSSYWGGVRATSSVSSGKWYWEVYINFCDMGKAFRVGIGTSLAALGEGAGYDVYSYGYEASAGDRYYNNVQTSGYASYAAGAIIGVALDLDNGKIWWAKNGVWQGGGDPALGTSPGYTGVSGTFFPFDTTGATNFVGTARFTRTQQTYTVPSGFASYDNIFELEIADDAGIADEAEVLHLVGVLDETMGMGDTPEGEFPYRGNPECNAGIQGDIARSAIYPDEFTDDVGSQDSNAVQIDYFVDIDDNAGIAELTEDLAIYMLDPHGTYHVQTANSTSIVYEIISPIGTFSEGLSCLEVDGYTGGSTNVELPSVTLEALASVGAVARLNAELPKLGVLGESGSRAVIELPSFVADAAGRIGTLGKGKTDLPHLAVVAEAAIETLARLDSSFLGLRLVATGDSGAVRLAGIKLLPLQLAANGKQGHVGTVDVSLPSLLLNSSLSHAPVGTAAVELPFPMLDSEAIVLSDSCLQEYILEHTR